MKTAAWVLSDGKHLEKAQLAIQDVTEENPTLDVPLSWSYGQPLAPR